MIQVSSQAQLQQALNGTDPEIVINEGFATTSAVTANGGLSYKLDLSGKTVLLGGSVTIHAGTGLTIVNTGAADGMCKRNTGFTAPMLVIQANAELTVGDSANINKAILDGGAIWTGTTNQYLLRGTTNSGIVAHEAIVTVSGTLTVNSQGGLQNNEFLNGSGGGVIVSGGGTMRMNGGAIKDCAAQHSSSGGNGGGVALSSNAEFYMVGGAISGCHAIAQLLSGGSGGAVYVNGANNVATFIMAGGTVENNLATNGGGVCTAPAATSRLLFTGGTIENNRASYGGGVQNNSYSTAPYSWVIQSDGTVVITSPDPAGTTAGLVIAGGTISGNSAIEGGGVDNDASTAANEGSHLLVTGGTVANNTASMYGGGVSLRSHSGSTGSNGINNVVISGNSAGQGGGVYTTGYVPLAVANSRIINNVATTGAGGGLYASNAGGVGVALQNTAVTGNAATTNGGGIYKTGTGPLNVTGSALAQNTAASGGALYVDNGKVTVDSATVSGNTGGGNGGIVSDSDGSVSLRGTVNIPDGISITSESNLFQVESSLAGAHIQINETDYVAPDSGRSPIDIAVATPEYPQLTQADLEAFAKPPNNFEAWYLRLSADNTRIQLAAYTNYEISYQNLMGATNPNPAGYNQSALPIVLAAPSAVPGYAFAGWYDTPTGGDPVVAIPEGTTGDITLYARWKPCTPCCICRCRCK